MIREHKMRMMLGDYCLAALREADYNAREPEGFYWKRLDSRGFARLPAGNLETAKIVLMDTIPEPCRPFITWEGEL